VNDDERDKLCDGFGERGICATFQGWAGLALDVDCAAICQPQDGVVQSVTSFKLQLHWAQIDDQSEPPANGHIGDEMRGEPRSDHGLK
jgi:hypothetical protein